MDFAFLKPNLNENIRNARKWKFKKNISTLEVFSYNIIRNMFYKYRQSTFDNCIRIYPTIDMNWKYVKVLNDMKTIYVRSLQEFQKPEIEPSFWKFSTDGIFLNNFQEDIYETVTEELIDKVVQGYNAVILMFGQTASGKSLTATGLRNSFCDRGIAPRIISDLFSKKEHLLMSGRNMCIQMSYIETFKTRVIDLLNSHNVLDFLSLKNVCSRKVKNEFEALKTLFIAEGSRQFSQIQTRSHAANGILTIHVKSKEKNIMNAVITSSKIHIIDLSGVDLCRNTTSLYKTNVDIGNANLVKFHISEYIKFLSQNTPEYTKIQQKSNILIYYLADSLNPSSILRCVGHLRVDEMNVLITLSLLRFGQILKGLKPQKLSQNVVIEREVVDPLLQAKIDEYSKEQDLLSMFRNEDLSCNLSQDRVQHMENVAKDYLHNRTNEIVLLNVTDAKTVLKVFKNLYNSLESNSAVAVKNAYDQAYQEALENFKNTLKTDSINSFKESRKGMRKSHDRNDSLIKPITSTVRISNAKESYTKANSIAKPRHSDQFSTVKILKRSRTASTIMKRTSTAKRRSTGSAASTSTVCNEIIFEELALPDEIPNTEEAWKMFVTDEAYTYTKLSMLLSTYEDEARELKNDYLNEIRELQKAFEFLEKYEDDSRKAELQRLFQIPVFDEASDCKNQPSRLENMCAKNLKYAHSNLLKQQERVLKEQTEFLVVLDKCKKCRAQIREQFELFCRNKYLVSVPLDVPSIKDVEESIRVVSMEKESDEVLSKCKNVKVFESLKALMEKEITKQIRKSKAN